MVLPRVNLAGDGPDIPPRAYARLLAELTEKQDVGADSYGLGGFVVEFEKKVAAALGKERAIVMPTGTLANLFALDLLSDRNRRRVLVQTDGHIQNDTGDSAQRLGGVVLVPIQDKAAGYTPAAMKAEIERAAGARVAIPFSAMVIETPVRRRFAQMIPLADMDAAVAYAKEAGLKCHLDGARVYLASAWTGLRRRGLQDRGQARLSARVLQRQCRDGRRDGHANRARRQALGARQVRGRKVPLRPLGRADGEDVRPDARGGARRLSQAI
jgi:threonine aldolase